jgi:hypothetical protein
MENNKLKISASGFFKKRFNIFKSRWLENFDAKAVLITWGIVPMGLLFWLFEGSKYGDGIFQAYTIPLEAVYTIFNLIFNQTFIIDFDNGNEKLILPCIFTLISMGLLTFTFKELLKLLLVLIVDGIELVWKKEDIIEDTSYKGVK